MKTFTQTSDADSEQKHSEIERFATLNARTITFWLQHHSSSCVSVESMTLLKLLCSDCDVIHLIGHLSR